MYTKSFIPALFSLALFLLVGGCDFGAAQQAVESMGVIVKLEPIETTVSGQIVDAASGELVETPVTLQFEGPDGEAVVDMYSDPLSSQEVTGGVTSVGIKNGRQPTSQNPVRLRVVAQAEGYKPTSEVIEIHDSGTKQFTLDLLSTNPAQQPNGASGVRDKSGTASAEGKMETDLDVRTPSDYQKGQAALHIPDKSILRSRQAGVEGQLTVDLSHYPANEATMDALPASGTIETGTQSERFGVVGYLNLRIQDEDGETVSRITDPGTDRTRTTVRLPEDAVHPSTGTDLQKGDELELFRYDTDEGTWHSDTTVTVRALGADAPRRAPASSTSETTASEGALALRWQSLDDNTSSWWAWGTRSTASCQLAAEAQVDANGQAGTVEVVLQRAGRKYSNTMSIDELKGGAQPLSALLGQSTVPRYEDYVLTLATRDGQSRTIEGVDPCDGRYSMTLPEPTSTPRTDVLFRASPECPGDQKVRITSVPTLTIYYRAQDAPEGTSWHTAGDDNITWVMDDPENPTYIKSAELRLDDLKQDTHYDMYTTYDGERYEASAHVPVRDTATIEEDRVLVTYRQDFSEVCS